MKAIIHSKYGSPDDLQLKDVDIPTPGEGEVLIKVHATSVHPDVWHVVRGQPYVLRLMGSGLLKPRKQIPGTDMAGTIEAVGANVTDFQPGDAVFGETHEGMQWVNGGTYAEYAIATASTLVHKPENVTFEQAAVVPTSGIIVLWNLDNGEAIQPGHKVLVNGAGGGVGSLALQIAKAFGAEVTAVDNTEKLDMLRTLGADHVIDYTKDNFTRSGKQYDLIFDIPGNFSFSDCKRVLTPEGKYILIAHDDFGRAGRRIFGAIPHFMGLMVLSRFQPQLPKPKTTFPSKKDTMVILKNLLETGKITPVVGKTFSLSQTVEAMQCMEEGKTLGKIIITP